MAVAQAHQAGFDEGLQAGIQGIIGTMLCLGSHPEFIAKVTDLSLSHIQELHNRLIQEEENAHG